jgi:hypothetical protein
MKSGCDLPPLSSVSSTTPQVEAPLAGSTNPSASVPLVGKKAIRRERLAVHVKQRDFQASPEAPSIYWRSGKTC